MKLLALIASTRMWSPTSRALLAGILAGGMCIVLAGCAPVPPPTPRYPAPIVRRACGPGAPPVAPDPQGEHARDERIAILPGQPIEGDPVRIWIPHRVAWECGGTRPMQTRQQEGVTVLSVAVTTP